jgi:5'(3')-deoxyribonucleotidase
MGIKIGVDLDNCLNNLSQVWIVEKYNKLYHDNMKLSDIVGWDLHNLVKPECGKTVYDLIDNELLKTLKPLPYTQNITKLLQDEGHEIFIVTATQSNFLEIKVKWLQKYYPHLDLNKMVVTNYKSLVSGLDCLIDDQPNNLELFLNDVICMDYAWNRDLKRDCPRCLNWNDIYWEIHRIDERNQKEKINPAMKTKRLIQEIMNKHECNFDNAKKLFDWKHE